MDDDNKIAPSEGTTDGKDTQKEKSTDEWKTIVGNKYKSEKELAEAYKNLEKKLGDESEKVHNSEEFAKQMAPLLEEIRKDPVIFDQLDKRLREKGQPVTKEANNDKTADNTELRTAFSNQALAEFEKKYGIDKLSPEDRKTERQKIGDVIVNLTGTTLEHVDLRRMSSVLDDAYTVANKDKIIEKSKLEAKAEAQGLEDGSISAIPSSQGKTEGTLTSEQSDIASKLGLTKEQYLEGLKGQTKAK
jgi:hypothetical protein